MIEDTIAELEAAVARLQDADPAKKAELARLLASLKAEVRRLEGASGNPRLSELADGLARSAKGFEASHPKLAGALDAICRELASLGI